MGCGKSTIGRKLARLMGYDFIDLDEYIESKYKTSIPTLFLKYGEANFRTLEHEALIELCESDMSYVLSTGGGAPCFYDNMQRMNQCGETIYINLPAGMLANRLESSKKRRPIVEGKSGEELREFIKNSLLGRERYYYQASLVVNGGGVSAEDIYNMIELKRDNIFGYSRRESSEVSVGCVKIGGDNPIVIQSMGNTDSNNIEQSVSQALSIEASGSLMVRFTAQGVREAESLGAIKRELVMQGSNVPIIADIHYNPEAAFIAAQLVDKVRINPGNFSSEERMKERFYKLLDICNEHNTAVRIGVNHGSLSNRIVERFGDTVEGMVESAMEYLRLASGYGFKDVVVSLKSSNTKVMVSAYRELSRVMTSEALTYPLHLGVTEAGNDIQGRSRSAVGIGTLLSEGIGSTIRVSLTENPANEAPFAGLLIDYVQNNIVNDICVEGFVQGVKTKNISTPFVTQGDDIDYIEVDLFSKEEALTTPKDVVVVNESSFHRRRVTVEWLSDRCAGKSVVLKREYNLERDPFIVALGVDLGALLFDGFIDGVWVVNRLLSQEECDVITLDVLQATRRRISSPEYISCPSCGRTLYDIERVLHEVKERTKGLKNIKLAVMGCIVNGPGEMADADYGYVGAGRGKVALYHKGEVYKRDIDESVAIDELIELLKINNEFK